MDLSNELKIAIQIAKDAGEILLQYYNKEQKITIKVRKVWPELISLIKRE